MPAGDAARLGIDLGAERIKAAVAAADGSVRPLMFDGAPWLPAGVAIDGEGSIHAGVDPALAPSHTGLVVEPHPVRHLTAGRLTIGGWQVDPIDLLAASLRRVAETARQYIDAPAWEVTVAVPATWGPRRRTLLRQAAHRASLDQPELVETPVAVAWYLLAGGTPLPSGAALLLCNFGAGFDATVVRRVAAGFDVLAALDCDAGGHALDTAIATHLRALVQAAAPAAGSAATVDAATLTAHARTAKEALSRVPRVVATVAATSVVLDTEQLTQVSRPVLAPAVAAARQALDAAELPPGQLRWVCCTGGGARLPVLAALLGEGLGVQPVMVAEPDLAAAYGAVHAAPATASHAPTRTRTASSVADVVGVLLPAGLSLALLAQFFAGADRYGRRQSIEPGMLMAHWGGLATASTLAMLAAVAGVAVATAARHPAEPAGDRRLRHRLIGAALGAGAVGGVVVAAVYATLAAGFFELDSGPFLRWAVLPVLPVAVAVVVLAAVVVWRPEPPTGSWLAWIRFPAISLLLIGLGTMLIGRDVTGAPHLLDPVVWRLERWAPPPPMEIIGPVGRLGALAVGAGVGWLLVRRSWHRLFALPPLAALVAVTLAWRTTGMIAVGVALAVAGWWLWRALHLVLRPVFLGTAPHGVPQPDAVMTGRPARNTEPAGQSTAAPGHPGSGTPAAWPADPPKPPAGPSRQPGANPWP